MGLQLIRKFSKVYTVHPCFSVHALTLIDVYVLYGYAHQKHTIINMDILNSIKMDKTNKNSVKLLRTACW